MTTDPTWDLQHDESPLNDPEYIPQHPPVNGRVPDVVARWGARSQVRWFRRYLDTPALRIGYPEADDYYIHSVMHKGACCSSCEQDRWEGYDDVDACCCRGIVIDDAPIR